MTEQVVTVNEQGDLQFIYADELLELAAEGIASTKRASHVEPAPGGGWYADLGPVGGPVLTGFVTRAEALAAEVAWLREHVLGG